MLFVTCLDAYFTNYFLKFFVKHMDELLVACLLVYVAININYILSHKRKLFFVFSLFLLVGFFSSFIFHYQPLIAVIIDSTLIVSRFMVGYLSVYVYTSKNSKKISVYLVNISKIITIILFVLLIHDLFFSSFFPKADFRYFTRSIQLMFPHPTYLAAACVTLLIFMGYKSNNNSLIKYMVMLSFIIFMTFRSKAIGFLFVYWVLFLFIFVFKSKNVKIIALLCGLSAVYLVREQLSDYYFTNGYSPRSILLQDSVSMLKNHFPLGTGFATFGSSVAVDYYSPLYVSLGYLSNWGMSKEYSIFLNDSFWPEIIAQFGIVGLGLFIYIIILFFKIATKRENRNTYSSFAMTMTLVYLLITSLAESSFFNPSSFLLFMLFAVYENKS